MAYFIVRKEYKYTVDHLVKAEDEKEAKDAADEVEGVPNNDDYWYDVDVHEIDEDQYNSYF